MASETVYLPDGQTYTVNPVAGGFSFQNSRLAPHEGPAWFPVGWTIGLQTEEEELGREGGGDGSQPNRSFFTQPSWGGDVLLLASSGPPSPELSREHRLRQVAMTLWVSLHWYFHQREPSPSPPSDSLGSDWAVTIRCGGGESDEDVTMSGLASMGLLATETTSVGGTVSHLGDGDDGSDDYLRMFITQRMFWQLPHNAFLLSPDESIETTTVATTTSAAAREKKVDSPISTAGANANDLPPPHNQSVIAVHPPLPAYYPSLPLQHTMTGGLRHPLRPRPPRMGSVFYTRFLPSVGRYLSFRVASTSPEPVAYHGPVGPKKQNSHDGKDSSSLSDTQLLEAWFAKGRVSAFWGAWEPSFLADALGRRHSFPAMGLWDGVPFGYFEIYWVREDILGRVLAGAGDAVGDFDRGLHVLVGEEWARGRASEWLTSLVHWCLTADVRTMNVCLEPRIDNERITKHLDASGFKREKQVTFPHKKSWFVRLRREAWTGPLL